MRCSVLVSDHAYQRYLERSVESPAGRRRLAVKIERRLLPSLRVGVVPDELGAVHIEFGGDLVAVCYPGTQGGWEVATIYRQREEEGA
jgi:hypothetical protein